MHLDLRQNFSVVDKLASDNIRRVK